LVKFEKPTNSIKDGKTSKKANTYTYITDGAFDIVWNDGSKDAQGNVNGVQTYNANKLGKIGSITETTEAKASSTTITLDTASLGSSISVAQLRFQSETLTGPLGTDFVEQGFQEGDKVYIVGDATAIAANQADATVARNAQGIYVIIKTFKDEGRAFEYTLAPSDNTRTFSLDWQVYNYTISLASEELKALTTYKTDDAFSTYMNREVFIYKAHTDIDTNVIIGEPYLLFKGIISNGKLTEDPAKGSSIIWTLSSHWGDFSRVSGRLTVDEAHRALDGTGMPDMDAVTRPEYAFDFGFMHANQAVNVMALYNDIEISYKQVDINGGWPGGKRMREVETVVERRTDLNFNLSPKYLPVIYGVNKTDSVPIFVDTDNADASKIYVGYAICEGPIAGILDLYVAGNSSICVDAADATLRSSNSEADLVCKGRMDRGNALGGYNASTSTYATGLLDMEDFYFAYNSGLGRKGYSGGVSRKNKTQNFNTGVTGADSATGMLHEQSHNITSPLDATFQFHAGLSNQKANPTLVNKAASSGFKIQNDYFPASKRSQYWSNQHSLLDTAYMVSQYTIAPGETSIPEIDFIVRGKGISCYNYDRSYNSTNVVTNPVTVHTEFKLGEQVTLKNASGTSITHTEVDGTVITSGTQTVTDTWTFIDLKGASQRRFQTDWPYDIKVSQ
jgi:hypothetical protein